VVVAAQDGGFVDPEIAALTGTAGTTMVSLLATEPEEPAAGPAVNETDPDLDVSGSRDGAADAADKNTDAARSESTAPKE
jgi:hypothetical protein